METKQKRSRPVPEDVCRRAIELGVAEARVVPADQVFACDWVRAKCQYGCGGYGRCLTCPPYSPTPQATRAMLNEYAVAVLLHGTSGGKVRKAVVDLEREAFLAGYHKAFGFGCGPCDLCDQCALEEGCRNPSRARPAMEAAGIDVFQTARAAGFPIQVVSAIQREENYYALLLLE